MGLFSDIISAIGNAASDVGNFFTGDNNNPQKKQQQNNTPTFTNPKVNLPSVLRAPQGGPSVPKPIINPVFTQNNNNGDNLVAQPIQQPQQGGFWHDLTHNPVTNFVGHDVVSPTINAGKDVGEVAATDIPELGLAAGRVGTGLVQAATQVPHIATALTATGTKALADTGLPGAGELNNVVQGANTGVKTATNFVNKPINWVNRGLDTAAQDYSNVAPLPGMGQQLYKYSQVPINVLVGAATLGAAPAAEGAAGADEGSDLISKIAQPIINRVHPVTSTLNAPVKSVVNLVRGGEAAEGAGDIAGDESAPSENTPPETGTKPIDEPVNSPAGETGTPTIEPGTTESGVKPNPTVPNSTGTPTPAELQTLESQPATPSAPIQATPTPADIQAAEDAAQQSVNKTAQSPPTATPAPTTAAADLTPKEVAALKAAESPTQIAAAEEPNIPDYTSPHKNGKASVPGNSAARYSTGDPNLDAIVNDAIIAHKGTAATADTRADALDQVGITSAQRAQIRNIATKNVNRDTGKISASGVKQIEDVIKSGKARESQIAASAKEVGLSPGEYKAQVNPSEGNIGDTSQTSTPASEPQAPVKLNRTGDPLADFHNAGQFLKQRLETKNNFDNLTPEQLLKTVNSRAIGNDVAARNFAERLDDLVGSDRAKSIQNALQTGTVDKLPENEQEIAKAIQDYHYTPNHAIRSAADKDYVPEKNYSPQLRTNTVRSAAQTAGQAKTLTGKVKTFNDLLNTKSRLSQARTLGKFTSGKTTLYGDPADLGLTVKKDGTIVDKAGKVYDKSSASNDELEAHGVKLHDLSTSNRIAARDVLALKDRTEAADTVLKNPEKFNLSDTATKDNQPSVVLKGSDGESHEFFTDKATQKSFQEAGLASGGGEDTGLLKSAWQGANSAVVQSIVLNPFVHGTNQLVQAVVASGLRKNGLGGLSLLKEGVDDNAVIKAADDGVYFPQYGKDTPGIVAKMTHGATKLNQRLMSGIDANLRIRAYNSLVRGGMDGKEAAAKVNEFMGDRSTLGSATKNMTIFFHYFQTLNKSAKAALVEGAHGHVGALANAGLAAAATYGLNKAWEDFTGNQGASVHAPGIVGLGKQYIESGNDLAHGHFKQALSPLTNRVNPLVSEGVQQLMNQDSFTGNKIATQPGQAGVVARLSHAASATPLTNFLNNNGHSVGEKVGNTLGLYEPHIKGDMATNNPKLASVLNVKGAKNASSPGFPKDFTGEQSAKQFYAGVDKSLQGLSAHDTDVLKEYYDTQVNQNGQKVKNGTVGNYANAVNLVTNDDKGGQALKHLYASQHSQTGNDPLWKLPLYAPVGQPSVKNYLLIASKPEGYEKDGTIQKMQGSAAGSNGWYDQLNAARTSYFSKFPPSKDVASEPAYPTFDKQTTADLKAADNISDPTQFSQYLDSHPDVASAFAATANWTNQIRGLEGAPPQEAALKVSPELTNIIKTYSALPPSKTAGNTNPATQHERSDWIKANPAAYNAMIQYFAQADMRGVIENSIKAEYSGQGVNSQSLLKDTKGAGSDIVENSNGTYSLNAPQASADAYAAGSGSGYISKSEAAYLADRAAGLPDDLRDKTVLTGAYDKGLKSVKAVTYKAPKLVVDKAQKANPFIRTITTDKGVKVAKDTAGNPFAVSISSIKGVKS